ncbi:MAG TPA: spore coat U domain-containing protein [Rhizomicrobium sp.]
MIRKFALAAFFCIFAPAAAHATSCSLSASGIQFGVFSGAQLTFVGTVTIDCTGNGSSDYTLKLSTGGSGRYVPRQMSSGTNTLSYNLYTNSALTQVWGDGTGGSTFVSGTFTGPSIHIVTNVYGNIPAQATPPPGIYSDNIVATLTCTTGGNCGATTSFAVTASVQPVCTISASNLAFGNYAAAQVDAQSQISLSCASATPWNVGLNQGSFSGATVTTRKMAGPGSSPLSYSLYQDAARSRNWGNTVGTDTVPGTGTGSAQSLNVYGRIPGAQTAVVPGNYADTIVVTLTY